MEFRINAEDPKTFTPSSGKIEFVHFPNGRNVRVDSHIYSGYTIPTFYDSMIAKLIVKAENRIECITLARRCLEEFTVEGIKTNIPLHLKIINDPDYQSGNINTNFILRYA